MGDTEVFRIDGDAATELPGQSMAVEESLQTVIENHLDSFLGVRFVASKRGAGDACGGRVRPRLSGGATA